MYRTPVGVIDTVTSLVDSHGNITVAMLQTVSDLLSVSYSIIASRAGQGSPSRCRVPAFKTTVISEVNVGVIY